MQKWLYMLAPEPNNLAGSVHGNDSRIPLARACKDEPVAEDICAYAANVVTCNSESLTGKTPRGEAHRWWQLHPGGRDKIV